MGGIAGYSYGAIVDSYNAGAVSASAFVGGIAGVLNGYNSSDSYEISCCYNYATINATSSIDCLGGLVGCVETQGVCTPSYTRENACTFNGSACVKAAVGSWSGPPAGNLSELTAGAFAAQESFPANWNFTDTWAMDDELGRPVLRVFGVHAHELVHHEASNATCTEPGIREHWRCDGCGRIFADEAATVEIPEAETVANAIGHSWTVAEEHVRWSLDDPNNLAFEFTMACENEVGRERTIVCNLDKDQPVETDGGELYFSVSFTADGEEYGPYYYDDFGYFIDENEFHEADLYWDPDMSTATIVIKDLSEDLDPVLETEVTCKIASIATASNCNDALASTYTANLAIDGVEYSYRHSDTHSLVGVAAVARSSHA